MGHHSKVLKQASITCAGGVFLMMPSLAMAQPVSGYLATSDWYVIIKDEGGKQTQVARRSSSAPWNQTTYVNFNVNVTPKTLNSGKVYIVTAGSFKRNANPFISGIFSGTKTVATGDPQIDAVTDQRGGTTIPDATTIFALTNGATGYGYTQTATVAFSKPKSAEQIAFPRSATCKTGFQNPLAIWSPDGAIPYDGNYVAFRIPYSALFEPKPEAKKKKSKPKFSIGFGGFSSARKKTVRRPAATPADPNMVDGQGHPGMPPSQEPPRQSSGSRSSTSVGVNVDVGSALNSIFGKKDKPENDPCQDIVDSPNDIATGDTITINSGVVTTFTDANPIDNLPDPAPIDNPDPVVILNSPSTETEAVYIAQAPEIEIQYVPDLDIVADRDKLREQNEGMQKYIKGLTNVIKERENTIREISDKLTKAQRGVGSIPALMEPLQKTINDQAETIKTQADEIVDNTDNIKKLTQDIQDLKNRPKPLSKAALISGGLGLAGLGGLAGLMLGRNRHNKHCDSHIPPAKREEKEKEPKDGSDLSDLKKGMVFAASQMALGGLPPTLAMAKPVYNAVGRIGFAQQGKPTGEEEAFGTGILIAENKVLTNRHVWEMFKDRLAGDAGAGIEFHAEKNKDKTDFVAFDGAEPVCLDGLDAAIFTLSRSPEARNPVSIAPRPIEQLNDLDIVVVGYPQAHSMTPEIAAVAEENPVFGVKRYSEGKIFRHTTDTDRPYGVEAVVSDIIHPERKLRAVCHNASTLGGSSGSAVICKKTGDLVALHFGFDTAFDWEEATNFAIAGDMLAGEVAKIIEDL